MLHARLDPTQGLDGKSGPKGRLLPCPSPTKTNPKSSSSGRTQHISSHVFLLASPQLQGKPIVSLLRQAGVGMLIYLDDMLVLHQEESILKPWYSTPLGLLHTASCIYTDRDVIGMI